MQYAIDLLFTSREGLVADVVVGGCLGYSDCEIIEFLIFGETRRGINKTSTLDFQRTHHQKKLITSSVMIMMWRFTLIYVLFPIPSSH